MLVEIEPGTHQSREEVAYEIASDTFSPPMSSSSPDTDDSEEDSDIPPISITSSPRDTGQGSFAVFYDDYNRV